MEKKKYRKVATIQINGLENDCDFCCFALDCIAPCRLPDGIHYEEVKTKK